MELTRCVIEVERPDCEIAVDYRYVGAGYTGTEDVVVVHLGPVQLVGPPEQIGELLTKAIDNAYAPQTRGEPHVSGRFPTGGRRRFQPAGERVSGAGPRIAGPAPALLEDGCRHDGPGIEFEAAGVKR